MRILLWHGYLLGGTGSNVYTRALAREWSLAGHDVTVVCQERAPGAVRPRRRARGAARAAGRAAARCSCSTATRGSRRGCCRTSRRRSAQRYVDANVGGAAGARCPADLVFTNHVLMGGAVGAGTGERFRVKAHGSELEYSMRGRPELEAWGREVLAPAEAVYVGSQHIREVLEEVTGHVERVVEVPPGVDVDEFVPQDARRGARRAARRGARRPAEPRERRASGCRTRATRRGSRRSSPADGPTVVYFGKLILNKGVHLLLEALGASTRGR